MGFLFVESCTVKKEGNKKINKEAHTYRKSRQEALREGMTTYGSRDTVTEAAKVPSGIIKAATNDISNIAKERIYATRRFWKTRMEHIKRKILW